MNENNMLCGSAAPRGLPAGVAWYPGHLAPPRQAAVLAEVLRCLEQAPLVRPAMPGDGKPFSVRMSCCGPLGWVSDRRGYRYQDRHPETGQPWPAIPPLLLALWDALTGYPAPPEACLINHYDATARMGLHQDRDEAALDAPVLSLSLGDMAVFRVGGTARRDPTRSVRLASGDAVLLAGPARLAFHGIDRVLGGSSRLLAGTPLGGGRLNLTLRRVTLP